MATMGKGILEVKLFDAKGLKDTDFFGKSDPYVIMQYRNQERKSSVARGQGSNPKWNETFKFVVQYPGTAGIPHKLVFKLMDKDTFTADDFLGEACVYVEDLILLGLEKGVGELHPAKYSVVLPDQSYSGEIRVALTFTSKVEVEDHEELGGWRDSFHHH
ncbi:Elicitor-responsive protein 1 [Apostasia shenzhenica]|uniref:Elicitor-responsive protein 1 n=1 Tax=Apostasia shenzhenica TaxID=1088818 RepID=A0A2I0A8V7_9ASPA|nr:Elicitor-responsive protein 1 [Apostasia shenzhenica]